MKVCVKGKKVVAVNSYAEASEAVRSAWQGGRGSTFYADKSAGLIWDDSGAVVAHVSFNGRVWQGGGRLAGGNVEINIREVA